MQSSKKVLRKLLNILNVCTRCLIFQVSKKFTIKYVHFSVFTDILSAQKEQKLLPPDTFLCLKRKGKGKGKIGKGKGRKGKEEGRGKGRKGRREGKGQELPQNGLHGFTYV